MNTCRWLVCVAVVATSVFGVSARSIPLTSVEILKPTGGLSAELVATFQSPRAYAETTKGEGLVLDAGRHSLYAINAARTKATRVVTVGSEPGHLLKPIAFSLGTNDIVAISDSPTAGVDRVQYFGADGRVINGFYVGGQSALHLTPGQVVLNGASSMQFTGRTFLLNSLGGGALITEIDTDGKAIRSIGLPRETGHESDPALHAAFNTGLPLVDPTGGFYFVFQTGAPMFRKYDVNGTLLFERHIEGVELDDALQSMPTSWPARAAGTNTLPHVPAYVQAAAVDPSGRLWVALTIPYTYVFDRGGDKIRTIQFQGSDTFSPFSFFFASGNRLLVTPGCYEFSSK